MTNLKTTHMCPSPASPLASASSTASVLHSLLELNRRSHSVLSRTIDDTREAETSALVARLALMQADHAADVRRILSHRDLPSTRPASRSLLGAHTEWSDLSLAFQSADWKSVFAACEFTMRVVAQAYRRAYELLFSDRRARKLIVRHFEDCQQALDLVASVRRRVRSSRVLSVNVPLPLPLLLPATA